MDQNKCRTCYTNLESNDLYLKLNVINKNSTLSLADKLRKLVPVMDLKDVDKLLICMQCSIHLETAYTFYTTCLDTEEKFQKSNIKSQSRRSCTSDEKKEEMICKTCNLHFSSKNIFDLHMKLMHFKKEPMYEEVVNDINIRVAKNNKPLLEMVFLQTDLKKRRKDSVEESSQEPESKRRRLILKKCKKSNRVEQKKLEPSKTDKKKIIDRYIEIPRNKDGKFKKSRRRHKSQEIIETPEIKSIIPETKEMLPDRSCKTRNKIPSTAAVTDENVNVTETKKENPNKTPRCKFCAKTFTSSENLMKHVNISHPGKCQMCALCNRFYMNMRHHKKQYGCDLFNFRKQNLMISDILSEKTKDTGQIIYYIRSDKNLPICLICRRICLSVKCLETHLTTMHTTGIRCLVCRKVFPAIPYCTHMGRGCSKLISGQSFNYTSDGECICPICNQVFKDETILKSHLVHHLYQNLQCEQCNEKFVQIASYCQHVVKGCQKKKSSKKKDSASNNAMFVKCDTEPNVETTALPQEDPLKDEPSQLQEHLRLKSIQKSPPPTIEVQHKNVKVEPTALLDQSGFVMGDDSLSNDNVENLPTKFMNITSVNAETAIDAPEFIYVVQNIGNQPSE